MPRFVPFDQSDLDRYLSRRPGEVKLGERCLIPSSENRDELLADSSARFVLLGLPEDAGVRANGGMGGAATAWESFLKSFLNLQDTGRFRGTEFMLWGQLVAEAEWAEGHSPIEKLREVTAVIDQVVFPVIEQILAAGKCPLVIGGGHNNAYPILKGASLALKTPLNALNLDAHSDYRRLEGRHSGNGFSYARHDGFLDRYAVLGLHESYNQEDVMALFDQDPALKHFFWEDIFLRKKISWDDALKHCLDHVAEKPFGIELDTDAIENALSSAATPVGIPPVTAMQFLYCSGKNKKAAYLHLPEAAAYRSDGIYNPFTGKLLAYLVQAFCKGVLERQDAGDGGEEKNNDLA